MILFGHDAVSQLSQLAGALVKPSGSVVDHLLLQSRDFDQLFVTGHQSVNCRIGGAKRTGKLDRALLGSGGLQLKGFRPVGLICPVCQ